MPRAPIKLLELRIIWYIILSGKVINMDHKTSYLTVIIFSLLIKIKVFKTNIKCSFGRTTPKTRFKSFVLTSRVSPSETSFALDAGGGEDTGGSGLVII
jgi:hypothetical protein